MRGSNHSQTLQESKQNTESGRRYPVSARAYKKKDYDYLSTFPRVALRAPTRHDDVELSCERSDGESDVFTTASSTDYSTSVSSASSTTSSSIQSYANNGLPLRDMESNRQHRSHLHLDSSHCHPLHHHHHQEDHHLQSIERSTLSPAMESTDLQKMEDEKAVSGLKVDSKDSITDLSSLAEKDSIEVLKEAPIKLQTKVRTRHIDAPAVLPKFGSWDTKNPSSGEAYTLIFRRLRHEKQSGGAPAVCGSPVHPTAEEADEPLRPESKAKEPLCPKFRTQKDSSRRKAKGTPHQDAAHYRMRWILCCKTSVLED